MSTSTPRRSSSGSTSAALPTTPTDSARPSRFAAVDPVERVVQGVGDGVEVAGLDPAAERGPGRRRRTARRRSFMVTASGCAPPMPPSPAVSVSVPAQRAAEPLVRPPRRTSRRCPAGCPGCRCRSTSRRSSGRTWSGPSASSRRNSGQVAQSPTRLELAISTRGAHSWVRSTPTGRPDCTSSVSSSPQVGQLAGDRVEARPVARGLAGAAVDDEVVGALGHLGVEVVLEHPQRGLGRPAPRGQRAAAGARETVLVMAVLRFGSGPRRRRSPGARWRSRPGPGTRGAQRGDGARRWPAPGSAGRAGPARGRR